MNDIWGWIKKYTVGEDSNNNDNNNNSAPAAPPVAEQGNTVGSKLTGVERVKLKLQNTPFAASKLENPSGQQFNIDALSHALCDPDAMAHIFLHCDF